MQASVGIVGGGAIGLWIAARLAKAGQRVSLLTRGSTLEAVQSNGIYVEGPDGAVIHERVTASNNSAELGAQDIVVFAVKGPSLSQAASDARGMIGSRTLILPAMNGVPWWFMDQAPGQGRGIKLKSVDPSGQCHDLLPSDQTIGCVVHASTKVTAPGHVKHVMGDGLIIGAVNAATAHHVGDVASILESGGYNVTQSEDVRYDIWYKLWGNMTMNPLSAITGATCDLILDDPGTRGFATAIMNEAAEIGGLIGCQISDSADSRHDVTRKLGAFKTSMLQDAEAGRPLEIAPLLRAPQEIARAVGVKTPYLDSLLGIMDVYERACQR